MNNNQPLLEWHRKLTLGALKVLRGEGRGQKLYDRQVLFKAFKALVDEVSRRYNKEHGSGSGMIGDATDRKFLALEWTRDFELQCQTDSPDYRAMLGLDVASEALGGFVM